MSALAVEQRAYFYSIDTTRCHGNKMAPGCICFPWEKVRICLYFFVFGHTLGGGMMMKIRWPKEFFAELVSGEPNKPTAIPPLPQAVEAARLEWLMAQNYYNTVSDKDLVDHAVYLMQATEKKYMYLLKKARSEGIRNIGFPGSSGIEANR